MQWVQCCDMMGDSLCRVSACRPWKDTDGTETICRLLTDHDELLIAVVRE